MKCLLFAAISFVFVTPLGVLKGTAEDAKDDFLVYSLPLFDGSSLLGWEGNAYWFRVEDKAIVAGLSLIHI